MDFYKRYYQMYLNANAETRAACKKHWMKIHAENKVKPNRNDLIIFSEQILDAIELAERKLRQEKSA